jgi:formylmethanofuran dehydrogenase subunit E
MNDMPFVAHPDLQRAVLFHGHYCPGLAIGYRAAIEGLTLLGTERAEDEELLCIVENDSCAVDGIQVITGCTFGKGNLVFRDYGKHVYTFAVRPSGRAVRLSLRPRDNAESDRLSRDDTASRILSKARDDLFDVREFTLDMPPTAERHNSVLCDVCGEPVMSTRTHRFGGQTLCRPCGEQHHE